jgi:tetratricopeptide (TPR) repeat protein
MNSLLDEMEPDVLFKPVRDDIRSRLEKFRLHPTKIYTLQRCKNLLKYNEQEVFREEHINWIKAIDLHPASISIEIAILLFEWYFASRETTRAGLVPIWQKLLRRATASLTTPKEVASLWRQAGILEVSKGNFEEAKRYFRNSSDFSAQIDDKATKASNDFELGVIYRNQGDYESAWASFTTATQLSKQSGSLKTLIYSQGQLANILAVQGNFTDALNILKESMEIWEQLSDPIERNMRHTTLHTLGQTYIRNGQFVEAIDVLTESLRLKSLVKERFDSTLRTQTLLAEAFMNVGKFEQAQESITESDIESCVTMGSSLYAASAFKVLSQMHFLQRNFLQSERFANRALEVANQSKNHLTQFEVLLWILLKDLRLLRLHKVIYQIHQFLSTLLKMRLTLRQFFKLTLTRLSLSFLLLRFVADKSAKPNRKNIENQKSPYHI